MLRPALAARFPGLEAMPDLDRTTSVSELESLFVNQAKRCDDRTTRSAGHSGGRRASPVVNCKDVASATGGFSFSR
jgi:hypothetical protein